MPRGAVPLYSEPIGERLLEPLVISAERHFAAKQLATGVFSPATSLRAATMRSTRSGAPCP